jgi:phosphohistidine phosphatase
VVEILEIKLLYAAVLFREEYSFKMEDDKLFTTNAQDVQNVANLQARLTASSTSSNNKDGSTTITYDDIPTVSIDDGAYKYVLISAVPPTHSSSNLSRLFVYSKRGAKYHVNVAEYLIPQLESSGYTNIQVKGGGRILRNDEDKKIHIFGYSYGFGMADHAKAKDVVERCAKYEGYDITWSNDGY